MVTVRVDVAAVAPVICTAVAEQEDSLMAAGVVQENETVPTKPVCGATEKVVV